MKNEFNRMVMRGTKAWADISDASSWIESLRWNGCAMKIPYFDKYGDPTNETLEAIEKWQPDFEASDQWAGLIDFVKRAWNLDYGALREECGEEGKALLCFVTGGWSPNETVLGAMDRNLLFHAVRWHSSYRGGLVKYVLTDA